MQGSIKKTKQKSHHFNFKVPVKTKFVYFALITPTILFTDAYVCVFKCVHKLYILFSNSIYNFCSPFGTVTYVKRGQQYWSTRVGFLSKQSNQILTAYLHTSRWSPHLRSSYCMCSDDWHDSVFSISAEHFHTILYSLAAFMEESHDLRGFSHLILSNMCDHVGNMSLSHGVARMQGLKT